MFIRRLMQSKTDLTGTVLDCRLIEIGLILPLTRINRYNRDMSDALQSLCGAVHRFKIDPVDKAVILAS